MPQGFGWEREVLREIGNIGYMSAGRVKTLPSWARYLISLGQFAVERREPGQRLVIGVSLPSRSFAAAFTALGVSAAAYLDEESLNSRAHFEWLVSLDPGTPIRFRRGRYLYGGRLVGLEIRDGLEYLVY